MQIIAVPADFYDTMKYLSAIFLRSSWDCNSKVQAKIGMKTNIFDSWEAGEKKCENVIMTKYLLSTYLSLLKLLNISVQRGEERSLCVFNEKRSEEWENQF